MNYFAGKSGTAIFILNSMKYTGEEFCRTEELKLYIKKKIAEFC